LFRWPFRLRNRWTVDEMRLDLAEIRSTVLLPLAVIAEVEDNLTAMGGLARLFSGPGPSASVSCRDPRLQGASAGSAGGCPSARMGGLERVLVLTGADGVCNGC
jgi:hypothetical protein